MDTPCAYHPNKEAESRCSICKKPICMNDARFLNQIRRTNTHKTTVGNVETQYYRETKIQKMFCIPCEAIRVQQEQKKMKRNKIIFLFIIIILASLIAYSWLKGIDVFGGAVTYGLLVVFLIFCCFIQSGEKRTKLVIAKAMQDEKDIEQSLNI